MAFSLTFAPLLPAIWLIIIIIMLGLFAVYGIIFRLRGAWFRLAAGLLLALSLANPSIIREQHKPLKTVIGLITDRSSSQKLGKRSTQTDALYNAIIHRIDSLKNFELRTIDITDQFDLSNNVSSALFKGLKSAFKDVTAELIGGAIMVTDGQIHDVPQDLRSLGFDAPLHVILTGEEEDRDRRIELIQAPRFGVVGEKLEFQFQITQTGFDDSSPVVVSIFANGKEISRKNSVPGTINRFFFDVPHGGKSILEFRAEADEREITTVNNRSVITLNGIRENLRVLLISGEPHPGERTWRNLLKSDSSVDLVHFTILRPPEKQDGTPLNELSLIAFPTDELFVQKIDEFDLIIFDRYRVRNVLPILYFDNIARYVRGGGGLLIASGPEFAGRESLARTPLANIFPTLPNGTIFQEPYRAKISDIGAKHPVTRNLPKHEGSEFPWGQWFRSIGVKKSNGNTVMSGPRNEPLLILNKIDQGRIALLLSDHIWLWARRFQGGGPSVSLLRRLSHWLMKEPELEEERLDAQVEGTRLIIRRQTLSEKPEKLVVITPSGEKRPIALTSVENGIWQADIESEEMGLYQLHNGDLSTFAHVGPASPREFLNVVSTANLIAPIVQKTGGKIVRSHPNELPSIIPIRRGASAFGRNWIGLEDRRAKILTGVKTIALFDQIMGLALLLFSLAAVWRREGSY